MGRPDAAWGNGAGRCAARDAVLTLAASIAVTTSRSLKWAGSAAKVTTFDTNTGLIAQIKSCDVMWAVDQQPYLQGYPAADQLWLYKTNGNIIGGGAPFFRPDLALPEPERLRP